jgi:AhpD family alkylhydroperoxidase
LSGSALSPEIREQIALAVAQTNLCEYSLAEHAYLATQLGLKKEQILASREARAMDKSVDAVLRFARDLAARKGECSVVELRDSGWSDSDIIEVIAYVALNVFENYLNDVARTDLDFPRVERSVKAA